MNTQDTLKTPKTTTITVTKEQNRRLRWLQTAANHETKDGRLTRPGLSGIHAEPEALVAADGWRLHAVKLEGEELPEMRGKTLRLPKFTTTALLLAADEVEETFPDWHVLLPAGEPVFEIGVSGKQLGEALAGMTGDNKGRVTLRFHGPGSVIEVLGIAADDCPAYALIMPMRNHSGTASTWRP